MRSHIPTLVALSHFLGQGQTSAIPHEERSSTCRKTKVAILGAGVAGITAAQTLHNASISDFIIVEHNDYIGGRVRNSAFGKASDGTPYHVELGANWVEGLESESGNVNPIWALAQKHKIKNRYSNYSAIMSYDEEGPNDYLNLIDEFDEKFNLVSQDAGYLMSENLQDTSVRAGLSVVGWKPKKDNHKQAAEWWGWDFETAWSPEQSGMLYGVAGNNATFKHFSDETNLVIDPRGFNTFIQEEAYEFLEHGDPRLLLNTTVKAVKYHSGGVKVHMEGGECIEAEHAICTFSVGVLQNNAVEFKPKLPRWKREAIEQFQMGTYTKIFMQFNETFWPEETEFFLYADPDERGYFPLFQSMAAPGFLEGSNMMFVTVVAQQAYKVEAQTDEETQEQIMEVLRTMFPDKHVPEPIDFMYPRWSLEKWAYGSYSNWPVGMTLEKHQNLRANLNRLWFAGEANSAEFFGYLQGAWTEGREVGGRVADLITGTAKKGSNDMKRYEVLHGTTTEDEYNITNGWSKDVDEYVDG